jgi:hypothetical protein
MIQANGKGSEGKERVIQFVSQSSLVRGAARGRQQGRGSSNLPQEWQR